MFFRLILLTYSITHIIGLKNHIIHVAGPFQRHVCDQKKWKISLLNGYSSWCKHAINKFRSLKIKFFVKVKILTSGHVCDFAQNYGPAPNDFKVNIL